MKERADILLVKKGLVDSREKAQNLIISGKVKIGGKTVLKPSEKFDDSAEIEISENINYVSRGYLKIKFAFDRLKISVKDKICADIGCSTGGFTQFLLESGAKKVFAVDIGVGVLHPKLRNDPRVVLYEGKDAKEITEDFFPEKIDFATCDVSFTSSIPVIRALKFVPEILVLCKPNFEVPRKYLKGGVLKDENMIYLAVKKVIMQVSDIFHIRGICPSFPPGSSGNFEIFLLFSHSKNDKENNNQENNNIDELIKRAIKELKATVG
jgi:23S rRNA (cytidine1920-2'-O)/16S rRNA (cytidine1409-2'-O)-methyltransferase